MMTQKTGEELVGRLSIGESAGLRRRRSREELGGCFARIFFVSAVERGPAVESRFVCNPFDRQLLSFHQQSLRFADPRFVDQVIEGLVQPFINSQRDPGFGKLHPGGEHGKADIRVGKGLFFFQELQYKACRLFNASFGDGAGSCCLHGRRR